MGSASRCTSTSLSVLVWKIAPDSWYIRRRAAALTRLPLWAMAQMPSMHSTTSGCTF